MNDISLPLKAQVVRTVRRVEFNFFGKVNRLPLGRIFKGAFGMLGRNIIPGLMQVYRILPVFFYRIGVGIDLVGIIQSENSGAPRKGDCIFGLIGIAVFQGIGEPVKMFKFKFLLLKLFLNLLGLLFLLMVLQILVFNAFLFLYNIISERFYRIN